jgi:DNA-binding transcriptional LysR family regulator
MRVEQVRAFVVLAEELNFRRAAARLFVSQPTLTAQLHLLERDLGVELFERGPGGTRLTAWGAELLPAARGVLGSIEELSHLAGSGPPPCRPRRVRLGLGPDGIGPATWPAVQALAAARPDLELSVTPLLFSTVLPAFDRGDVDALLLHGPVDESPVRRVVTVGRVRVGVLVPQHHWLADRATLDLDEVVPVIRAVPPREMGEAFARFWYPVHPAPASPVRMSSERTPEMASEAARTGLVGLWPTDIPVPPSSGAVVRALAPEQWAPLQVVTWQGWPLTDDLVAAARCGLQVAAASPSVADRPVSGAGDQQS